VWTVSLRAGGGEPGSDTGNNQGGLVVYLTNGDRRKEVSRVAYVRRNSKNPKTSFEKQLRKEMDKGSHGCQRRSTTRMLLWLRPRRLSRQRRTIS
jgi:hypothetical protein